MANKQAVQSLTISLLVSGIIFLSFAFQNVITDIIEYYEISFRILEYPNLITAVVVLVIAVYVMLKYE